MLNEKVNQEKKQSLFEFLHDTGLLNYSADTSEEKEKCFKAITIHDVDKDKEIPYRYVYDEKVYLIISTEEYESLDDYVASQIIDESFGNLSDDIIADYIDVETYLSDIIYDPDVSQAYSTTTDDFIEIREHFHNCEDYYVHPIRNSILDGDEDIDYFYDML